MPTVNPAMVEAVPHENRIDHPVVQILQQQVVNSFVLYTNYKHYQWGAFGPFFREMHLMFDEFALEVLCSIDLLVEHIRMIGPEIQNPKLKQVQEAAHVSSAVSGQSMRGMLAEAEANLLVVIKEMRDGARAAEENNDPDTVDLFSRIVPIHEGHEWFLRKILKTQDGLTD